MAFPRLRLGIVLLTLLNACGSATALLGDGEWGTPEGGSANHQGGASAQVSSAATAFDGKSGGAASDAARTSTGGKNTSASGVVAKGGTSATTYAAEELNRATSRCGTTPWIFSGLVPNSRDLGGVPAGNTYLECDLLYRGSQLNGLNSAGCTELAELGIRTIIDLRTDSEVSSYAQSYPVPACVEAAKRVAAPMPTPYGMTPAAYITDLKQPATLRAVFEVLAEPTNYPVYFHCIYGRDRTSVLAALLLRLFGIPREIVTAEYMRNAERGTAVYPASLEAMLDELERLGGAEAYLLSCGVTAEAIAAFRARVTPAL